MVNRIVVSKETADLKLFYDESDNHVEIYVLQKEDCYLNIDEKDATKIVAFLTEKFNLRKPSK